MFAKGISTAGLGGEYLDFACVLRCLAERAQIIMAWRLLDVRCILDLDNRVAS